MTERQHTPGPWRVGHVQGAIVYAPDGFAVANACTYHGRHGHADVQAANARLMAAAPQMLAVLQELRECADYWSEYHVPLGIVERIDAAIMAATQAAA